MRVVNTTTEAADFDLVLWFSARDIDLREDSARLVEPDVLSLDDVARVAMALLQQVGYEDDSTDPQSWLERALCSDTLGRVLWAFDNFETLANPQELFTVVEQAVQEPHKVLITTRHRESVGDFPIEVPGMERDEFEQLVNEECVRIGLDLGVAAASLTELYEETSGHPYITKILLGELRENPRAKFGRVLERRDNLLEALFERTFTRLGPDTQHVFLLSCSWRSMIPQLALEVALNGVSGHGIDVESALDELALLSLVQLSFVEEEAWVVIPLPARIFGSRKLTTDPRRIDLETESRVMQLFGPTKVVSPDQLRQGAQHFWVAAERHLGTAEWSTWKPLVERVARQVPDLWKQLGQAYASAGMADSAIEALRRSAEARPNDPDAWLELARAHETFDANRAALDAWVHRALLPAATIDDVSFAANKVNGWLARARIKLDPIERRLLIDPLTSVLERRSGELSARDYSRLGWLYMNVGEKTEALSAAERGIRLDPTSADCASLADRANP